MTRDEAIAKIKKLLVTKGRTHAESETAQILAAALADKHGIDIAQVDQADEQRRAEITHRVVAKWFMLPCEANYAVAIAKRFFEVDSITLCTPGFCEELVIVGTDQHIQIAEYIIAFLIREFRWQWNHRRGRCRNRKQFIYGCYISLYSKLSERFARPAKPGSNELEVSWETKRREYIERVFGKDLTKASIAPKKQTGAAIWRGREAGNDIEIRPGVNSSPARTRRTLPPLPSNLLPAP